MMKKIAITLSLLLATVTTVQLSRGEDAKHDDKAPTTQKSEPVNKLCPIGGEKVDPKVTIDYKGKTIGFCCKDCIADFNKDPEKYMKTLK